MPSFSHAIAGALEALTQPFWFANIVIPAVLFGASIIVRAGIGVILTSGADALLAIIGFDLCAIADAGEFQKLMVSAVMRQQSVRIHLLLLFFAAAAWFLLVRFGEPAQERAGPRSWKSWFIAVGGLTTCVWLIIVHVVAYNVDA